MYGKFKNSREHKCHTYVNYSAMQCVCTVTSGIIMCNIIRQVLLGITWYINCVLLGIIIHGLFLINHEENKGCCCVLCTELA